MRRPTQTIGALLIAAVMTVSPGCEDDPEKGGGINRGAKLSRLEGKLAFLGNNSSAKVSLVAGKQQIAGRFDPRTKKFTFDRVPDGPKGIIVRKGDNTFALRFPKSREPSQSDKLSSTIPDTNVLNEGRIDLGTLTLAGDGNAQHFTPQNNPLDVIDTDQDGVTDLNDSDVDGDGVANWDDQAPWGEGWEGEDAWIDEFGWDEEHADTWDADGDGEVDWSEDDAEWIDWSDIPDEDCGFDEEYTLEQFCAEFPEDPLCASLGADGQFDWEAYCAENIETDPSCWDALDDPCLETPDDPACAAGSVEECDWDNDPDCGWE